MNAHPTAAPSQSGALDIAAALADPTRHAIYNAIVEAAGEPRTVTQIAEQFSLHPNVARMHLQKLVDVGLVRSGTRKSSKGGRPARVYHINERAANLHFPPRDYQALATATLQALMAVVGDDAGALDKAGIELGHEEGRRALKRDSLDPETADMEAIVGSLRVACAELGLFPQIDVLQDGSVRLDVRNCVFRELSSRYPEQVCRLHSAILQGLLEEYMSAFTMESLPGIFDGRANSCVFTVHLDGPRATG
jgi:predicted ArsR family transcriptional regulator